MALRQLVSLFCVLSSLFLPSYAIPCTNYTFSTHKVFNSCIDLPYLRAHLHWNYLPNTKTIEIAYRARQSSNGWVAWGINPTSIGMPGSQALIGFLNSNGNMMAYTAAISNYDPSLQPGALSFPVSNITGEFVSLQMTIFAVIGPLENDTSVNYVWQAGKVSGDVPQMHPMSGSHLRSLGTLNFVSG